MAELQTNPDGTMVYRNNLDYGTNRIDTGPVSMAPIPAEGASRFRIPVDAATTDTGADILEGAALTPEQIAATAAAHAAGPGAAPAVPPVPGEAPAVVPVEAEVYEPPAEVTYPAEEKDVTDWTKPIEVPEPAEYLEDMGYDQEEITAMIEEGREAAAVAAERPAAEEERLRTEYEEYVARLQATDPNFTENVWETELGPQMTMTIQDWLAGADQLLADARAVGSENLATQWRDTWRQLNEQAGSLGIGADGMGLLMLTQGNRQYQDALSQFNLDLLTKRGDFIRDGMGWAMDMVKYGQDDAQWRDKMNFDYWNAKTIAEQNRFATTEQLVADNWELAQQLSYDYWNTGAKIYSDALRIKADAFEFITRLGFDAQVQNQIQNRLAAQFKLDTFSTLVDMAYNGQIDAGSLTSIFEAAISGDWAVAAAGIETTANMPAEELPQYITQADMAAALADYETAGFMPISREIYDNDGNLVGYDIELIRQTVTFPDGTTSTGFARLDDSNRELMDLMQDAEEAGVQITSTWTTDRTAVTYSLSDTPLEEGQTMRLTTEGLVEYGYENESGGLDTEPPPEPLPEEELAAVDAAENLQNWRDSLDPFNQYAVSILADSTNEGYGDVVKAQADIILSESNYTKLKDIDEATEGGKAIWDRVMDSTYEADLTSKEPLTDDTTWSNPPAVGEWIKIGVFDWTTGTTKYIPVEVAFVGHMNKWGTPNDWAYMKVRGIDGQIFTTYNGMESTLTFAHSAMALAMKKLGISEGKLPTQNWFAGDYAAVNNQETWD